MMTAEAFIEEELEVRLRSFLPHPEEEEAGQIIEARAALEAVRALEAENARLRTALEQIESFTVPVFDWPPEEWAKHTPETCSECKRWRDMKHPLQHSCDGWYRLHYARQERNQMDRGDADMRQIAREALQQPGGKP
jgi:hypothetical protein